MDSFPETYNDLRSYMALTVHEGQHSPCKLHQASSLAVLSLQPDNLSHF